MHSLRRLDSDGAAAEHEHPAGDGFHARYVTTRPDAFQVAQARYGRDDRL
jgi:hypothetical protein